MSYKNCVSNRQSMKEIRQMFRQLFVREFNKRYINIHVCFTYDFLSHTVKNKYSSKACARS